MSEYETDAEYRAAKFEIGNAVAALDRMDHARAVQYLNRRASVLNAEQVKLTPPGAPETPRSDEYKPELPKTRSGHSTAGPHPFDSESGMEGRCYCGYMHSHPIHPKATGTLTTDYVQPGGITADNALKPVKPKKVEGDPGTWSHCGRAKPHTAHLHSFAMNEGPYTDVQCNGTPQPSSTSDHIDADALRRDEKYAPSGTPLTISKVKITKDRPKTKKPSFTIHLVVTRNDDGVPPWQATLVGRRRAFKDAAGLIAAQWAHAKYGGRK